MKGETEQFEQMAATLTVFKIKAEWLSTNCVSRPRFIYFICLHTMQIKLLRPLKITERFTLTFFREVLKVFLTDPFN